MIDEAQSPMPIPDSGPRWKFEFTGTGGEYFKILLVNLLLGLLTLGIYSAWGKVRREQFLLRHTRLNNEAFDYHGRPLPILKGRIVAAIVIGLAAWAQESNPVIYAVLILAAIPAMPWFILNSLRFRARNSSWRGLRLDFHGTYRQALATITGHGILAGLSLGLWMPGWRRAQIRFRLGNLGIAGLRMSCTPGLRGFYAAYGRVAALVGLPPLALVLLLVLANHLKFVATASMLGMLGFWLGIVWVSALIFLARPLLEARVWRHAWNSTSLEGHAWQSDLRTESLALLQAKNIFLMVLSLGIYYPWALVAEYRLHLETLEIDPVDLSRLDPSVAAKTSAIGEGMTEAFNLDFSW